MLCHAFGRFSLGQFWCVFVLFFFFLSRIKSLSLCVPGDGAVVGCGGVPRQPVHLLDHWKHLRCDVSFNKSQTNHCFRVNSFSGELKVNLAQES